MEFESSPEDSIFRAMKYSLFAGGKRVRPILMLATAKLVGVDAEEILPFAAGLEMIHTYSLIHDDLPSMDNDDFRRGKQTSHKVHGEALAILAGDALLTYAFEVVTKKTFSSNTIKAINVLSKAAGCRGMIAGQIIDMESEGKDIDIDLLKYMHKCKTSALISAAVKIPLVLSNISKTKYDNLMEYVDQIGMAFQIKDDILDNEGDFQKLGKPIGSDKTNEKSTFVTLIGLEKSKRMLTEYIKNAKKSLEIFDNKAEFLSELADYIMLRNK
jgi:geranylgeranyl diphosphate synthase type II